MTGDLTINGYDAYTRWGISLSDGAISALMTPAPMKERLSNDVRTEHGSRTSNQSPKLASRDVTLEMHLSASSRESFFSRYESFCSELATGKLHIITKYQPSVTYRMLYVSCAQFTAFLNGLAKFSLKLTEPNPNNRSTASVYASDVLSHEVTGIEVQEMEQQAQQETP